MAVFRVERNKDYTLKGLSLINREKIDAIREAIRELERAGVYRPSKEARRERTLAGCFVNFFSFA